MPKLLKKILFLFFSANLIGQEEIAITGDFLPYETYYISSIDLTTGGTDVQLFNFLISSATDLDGDYTESPIQYHARFKLEILSPELGFNEKETLIEVQTKNMISMKHPINLDNRDFNLNNLNIVDIAGEEVLDEYGQPTAVDLIEVLNIENYEKILSAITSMGKLPDGEYFISFHILDASNSKLASKEKTINVSTPTSVNLIYPSGTIADTAQNISYTPYPVFQWSTQTCSSCELFIRVAEFNPTEHHSLDDAIEDVTSFPINQTQGWGKIDNNTSFQYPIIGAKALEEGKLYVWQIKKEVQTTLGIDSYLSSIAVFKISEASINTNTQILSDPILLALKEIIGEESFKIYFGVDGELSNYSPNSIYRINKESCNSNDILRIIDQLRGGTISIIDLNIE